VGFATYQVHNLPNSHRGPTEMAECILRGWARHKVYSVVSKIPRGETTGIVEVHWKPRLSRSDASPDTLQVVLRKKYPKVTASLDREVFDS
jgi:hypothetical protein